MSDRSGSIKPRARMVPIFYWDYIIEYLRDQELASWDELLDFEKTELLRNGAECRPYIVDAFPDPNSHKVAQLLVEQFITPKRLVFGILPCGSFIEPLPLEEAD